MDRPAFQAWLDRYIAAWRSGERSDIEALFSDDVRYFYGPFDEGLTGRAAVADGWLREPDVPGSWEAEYHPLAIDGDVAVATGESRYTNGRTYSNVFVCRFDADGRCREFREWFIERPRAER